MVDWDSLGDAYGPAGAVSGLLAAAADSAADNRGVWNELWARLCHQDSVYSASYAALPALAEMATRPGPAARLEAMILAAAIITTDTSPDHAARVAQVRHRYATELTALADLAQRRLALAGEDGEFAAVLEALMAFEDVPVWQRVLCAFVNTGLHIECADCSAGYFIEVDGPDCALVPDFAADTPRSPINPADPAHLSGRDAWVHALAVRHGRRATAQGILHLLGHGTCTNCSSDIDIFDALAAREQ